MVAGYSAAQVRAAEAPHLAAGEPLMRRAASALAAVLRRELAQAGAEHGPVLALVGPGDNGGDALYAVAELSVEGVQVVVVPVAARMHVEASEAARAAGARFLELSDRADAPDDLAAIARSAAVVVDGILGTGTAADPALRGRARDAVTVVRGAIADATLRDPDRHEPDRRDPDRREPDGHGPDRRRGIRVVAVDLPSGIHPDDGSVPDPTVLRATTTVTFGGVKAGLLIEPGADYAGRIEFVDLGLGPELDAMTPLVERA